MVDTELLLLYVTHICAIHAVHVPHWHTWRADLQASPSFLGSKDRTQVHWSYTESAFTPIDKFLMTFLNYMQHLIKINRPTLKMLRQEYFQV